MSKAAGSAASTAASTMQALDATLIDESKFQSKVRSTAQKKLHVREQERKALQKTDLGFVERRNDKALEREMASMFLDVAGRFGTPECQTGRVDALLGLALPGVRLATWAVINWCFDAQQITW